MILAPSRPRVVAAAAERADAPTQEHRVVTIVAAASLLVVAGPAWSTLVVRNASLATGLGAVFPLLLAAVTVALTARRRRTLVRLDAALIVLALGCVAVRLGPVLARPRYVVDESVLVFRATAALAHGHNPYSGDWAAQVARVPTLLLDGTNPSRFGYPPLSPLLGAALSPVTGTLRAPVVLTTLGLLATAAILYRLLPVPRRALVVPAIATVSLLPFLAGMAYPAAVMIPLLVVACHRPARIGAGGTLGRRGVVQAIALGLAAATQQLAWFVVPFLLVALWRARRGDLDRRPAAYVTVRFAAVAAVAFAVINLPFALIGPRTWLRGITDPLLQHAMFNGPGLPNLTLRIVGGGGNLGYWTYVAVAVFAGLLVSTALWPRQLGAGAIVLPLVALWASLRAQTIYYDTMLPLVFAAVASGPRDFADARPLRLGRCPRWVVPAVAAIAAAGFTAAAMVTPAPLRVRVDELETRANNPRLLGSLTLSVRNTSDHDVTPHVVTDVGAKFSLFLRQTFGPRTLRPGQSAELVVVPSPVRPVVPRPHTVYVVSDDPGTLSSATVPRGPSAAPARGSR